jgi:DNA-binding transcriptional LysR family regulator
MAPSSSERFEMNFQQLRHFVSAADAGNIIKAADILNISPSGLSRSISSLEHQIGLPLFERGPKGIVLTDFGRHFLPGARQMLNDHRRYVDELKAFRELRAGSVTVGISNSFAYFLIPEATVAMIQAWPSIRISVAADHYRALVSQLLTGDVDMALSLYSEESMHEELSYERLCDLSMVALCRSDHPLLAGGEVDDDTLTDARWALINGETAQGFFYRFFEQRGLASPTVVLRCSAIPLLASTVGSTDLLTVLPEEVLRSGLAPRLTRLPTKGAFGQAKVGLIRRRSSGELPIAAKLATEIRKSVRRMQDSHSRPQDRK